MDGSFSTATPGGVNRSVFPKGLNAQDGVVQLPSGENFLRAEFSRLGPDLQITTLSGDPFVVPGYFMDEVSPTLETSDGAVLSPKMVTALVGPMTPGQVAQAVEVAQSATHGSSLGASIGQVSEAQGSVKVRHVDGSQGELTIGSEIFQGDVLETDPASSVSVIFADDTVFLLDESGRMVIDEMVFDPGTQSGVFNAQVVQGVFSFVSGQVAKTSPDGMVVETPTATIGIRGSTVLGKAAAEGAENKITLAEDVDGNVGEIIITNGAGTLTLNSAGATTTVFSANAAPTPPIFLSPMEIQQNFGESLTKLTQVLAQKAEADLNRAQEDAQKSEEEAQRAEAEAQQAQEEAQQAEAGAQEADAEAEAAQAEAEAAKAEAEAAKAEAEVKGDAEALAKAAAAEAKAAEAEVKAAEAEVKAQAEIAKAQEVRAAAEVKASDAITRTAEAEKAQASVEKAVQFTTLTKSAATLQVRAFEEVAKLAPLQQAAVEKAATATTIQQQAQTSARAEAITKMAMDAAETAPWTTSAEVAIRSVAEAARSVAESAARFAAESASLATKALATVLAQSGATIATVVAPLRGIISTDTNTSVTSDVSVVTSSVADETITAPATGSAMIGTVKDTNFHFSWPSVSGGYTVSDAGGTNQISFDTLDDAQIIITANTTTSGSANMWDAGYSGGAFSENTLATLSYSGVNQFLVSDQWVASFASNAFTTGESISEGILKISELNVDDVAYIIVGTDSANQIHVNSIFDSGFIFGKGGDDTIYFENTASKKVVAFGGATTHTDNVAANEFGIPDAHINTFDYSGIYAVGNTGIYAELSNGDVTAANNNQATVKDYATHQSSNPLFRHDLWQVGAFVGSNGNDEIRVNSGNYNSISGGDGADTITVSSDAKLYTLYAGGGNDSVYVDASVLAHATTIDGGAHVTGDSLTINVTNGNTAVIPSSSVIINFEQVYIDARSSMSAVVADGTSLNGTITFVSSDYSDDRYTCGTGVDLIKYMATSAGGGIGDEINNFTSGTDKFHLLSGIFNGANVSGTLDSQYFVSGAGAVATNANHHFIFDTSSHKLSYDSDGNGASAAVVLADLSFNPATVLASTDIEMVST